MPDDTKFDMDYAKECERLRSELAKMAEEKMKQEAEIFGLSTRLSEVTNELDILRSQMQIVYLIFGGRNRAG